MNDMTDDKLREIINTMIENRGEEGAKEFISAGAYPQELKDRAIKMITGELENEVVMAEHGDISDSNGF